MAKAYRLEKILEQGVQKYEIYSDGGTVREMELVNGKDWWQNTVGLEYEESVIPLEEPWYPMAYLLINKTPGILGRLLSVERNFSVNQVTANQYNMTR